MSQTKILVKVNPEGKYVVDLGKGIDVGKCTPNTRVALRNDSYELHKICLLYTSPSPRDATLSRMPSSA